MPLKAILLLAVAVLAGADVVLAGWYAHQTGRALEGGLSGSYPAGVVLFGDFSAGGIGHETERRLGVALELYRAGRLERILCVGGNRRDVPRRGAELMRDHLVAEGVSPAAILVGHGSYDTHTNLQEIAAIAEARGWVAVVIISSPLHLARVRALAATLERPVRFLFAPYDYDHVHPPVGGLELLRQVHYEWVVNVLDRAFGAERLTAFARFLRNGAGPV